MQTLSFILVAAPLSFVFGLGLGIAAFKSKRVEKALYPILLVMQTMPQYAVLVPAIVLFGVGDHAAVIITMVVAVPLCSPNMLSSFKSKIGRVYCPVYIFELLKGVFCSPDITILVCSIFPRKLCCFFKKN